LVQTNVQAPVGQRLVLQSEVEPQMLMAVDDVPLPPAPPPQRPPAVEMPVAASALPPAPEAVAPPPAAKKKPKKKAARATQVSGTVPASAAVAKGAASVPPAETLEEATARLRSALAAPGDAGTASGDGAR